MPTKRRTAVGVALALFALGCGDAPEAQLTEASPRGPFLRVLGTAQDGGLPHAACACDRCRAARLDPELARWVASLAVVLPASGRIFLIDASPDLPEQLEALADVRQPQAGRVDRAPVDGVLLTHAHMGHYLGLAWFGYEAVHTRELPVWCTSRMATFLKENGPWSLLLSRGNVELRELDPGAGGAGVVELGEERAERVSILAVPAPHRDEYTDTVGFLVRGPRRSVFYVPDTDSWAAWGGRLDDLLAEVEVALVDGTFYSRDELPDRQVSEIGHPLITDSLERFGEAVRAGRLQVFFTHLNHSNPALDPEGPERRAIERAGFRVLEEGEEIEL